MTCVPVRPLPTIRSFQSSANGSGARPLLPRTPFGACLLKGDTTQILSELARVHGDGAFDMVFADPPYLLSNGGITCKSGRVASVDKGAWDRSRGFEADFAWNLRWLGLCQKVMRPDATIWVTGSQHNLFSVGFAMRRLRMKVLNVIAWEKPDPPPNLSCRCFTHSTEFLIWAARDERSRHVFNYEDMFRMAGGAQMQTVWRIPPPASDEKRLGRHPAQKPVALVRRAILASSRRGDVILDPFVGSGTTSVAALETGRDCVGLDDDLGYLQTAARRIEAALRARRLSTAAR